MVGGLLQEQIYLFKHHITQCNSFGKSLHPNEPHEPHSLSQEIVRDIILPGQDIHSTEAMFNCYSQVCKLEGPSNQIIHNHR